jgi:hypothetical protein
MLSKIQFYFALAIQQWCSSEAWFGTSPIHNSSRELNGRTPKNTACVVAPQRSDMFPRFEREAMNSRGER